VSDQNQLLLTWLRSFKWFKAAAEGGHAEAQCYLSMAHRSGSEHIEKR